VIDGWEMHVEERRPGTGAASRGSMFQFNSCTELIIYMGEKKDEYMQAFFVVLAGRTSINLS
jgi:hypothetical protein